MHNSRLSLKNFQYAHLQVSHSASLWQLLLRDQLPHQYTVAEDVGSLVTPAHIDTNMGCQQGCHSPTSSDYEVRHRRSSQVEFHNSLKTDVCIRTTNVADSKELDVPLP